MDASRKSITPPAPTNWWWLLFKGFGVVVAILIVVGIVIAIRNALRKRKGGGKSTVLDGYIDISSLELTQESFKDMWLNKKDIMINDVQLYPKYKYLAYSKDAPTHYYVGKEPPPKDNRTEIKVNGIVEYTSEDFHFEDVSQYGECFSTAPNALSFKKDGDDCVVNKCLYGYKLLDDGTCSDTVMYTNSKTSVNGSSARTSTRGPSRGPSGELEEFIDVPKGP